MKAFRKSGRQETALCAAFFEAVSAGDMETVQKMLDLGVPVNSTNASGQTALFLCRDRPVAELLLDRGADMDWEDHEGQTPLFAVLSRMDLADLLAGRGADTNHRDREGRTPIFYARTEAEAELLLDHDAFVFYRDIHGETILVQTRDTDLFRLYLEEGADPCVCTAAGVPLLVCVAREDRRDLVELLLRYKCLRKQKLKQKERTFLKAYLSQAPCQVLLKLVEYNDMKQIRWLVEQGASLQVRDRKGQGVLHKARDGAMVRFLLRRGADPLVVDNEGNTPLHMSAVCSDAEAVEALLQQGLEVNARNADGETPLFASYGGRATDVLLRHHADVHARDSRGRTALMRSYIGTEIMEALLDAGVDIDARDNYGKTALMYMHEEYQLEFLLDHGADINATDNRGRTALMELAMYPGLRRRRAALMELLLRRGADPNIRDAEGCPALMHVLGIHHYRADIQVLAAHGADARVVDKEGRGVLHHCLMYSWPEHVPDLLAMGADPNLRDAAGKTPLVLLLEKGNTKSAATLWARGARCTPEECVRACQMALENNLCDRDELQAFFRETGWDLELLLPEGTASGS